MLRSHRFQPSAARTLMKLNPSPSAEALGYFHSVRCADGNRTTLAAKPCFCPLPSAFCFLPSAFCLLLSAFLFRQPNPLYQIAEPRISSQIVQRGIHLQTYQVQVAFAVSFIQHLESFVCFTERSIYTGER